MKKWISTILSISLVIGMAAVLHACGKPKSPETTTAAAEAEAAGLSDLFGVEDESQSEGGWENYLASLDDIDESYSAVERTTNKNYQKERDALTLPFAITTQPVAGTTRSQTTTNPAVRETTTQFQFTYYDRINNEGKTAAVDTATTAAAANTATTAAAKKTDDTQQVPSETTSIPEIIAETNVSIENIHPATYPQITYLDLYVTEILDSGRYTMETEFKTNDGMVIPMTYYVDGEDTSTEFSVTSMMASSLALPSVFSGAGKIRFVTKDMSTSHPKAYLVLPTGYIDVGGDDLKDFVSEMKDAKTEMDLRKLLQLDRLQFCAVTQNAGSTCETYMIEGDNPSQNIVFNFYFTRTSSYEGLARVEMFEGSSTTPTMVIGVRLYRGVTDSKAFEVKGKQISIEDAEKLFS